MTRGRFLAAGGLLLVAGWALWRVASRPPGHSPHQTRHVAVAAAADLRFAFDDLRAQFQRVQPDIEISATYGSSGMFSQQLIRGAPFDLFLSADREYPALLAAKGLILPGSQFTYAVGRIVIWAPASSSIDLEHLGFKALEDPSVAHVAVANPEHAPYGRAAVAALTAAGVFKRIQPKLVYGENIAQTLQFVQSRAADLGVVALSLVVAPTVKETGRYWNVPTDTYPAIEQGGAVLASASDREAALELRAFMLSEAARETLERYGFGLPEH
jgi:molybdate transport system substrate-binding protein